MSNAEDRHSRARLARAVFRFAARSGASRDKVR
jgi:hypothetical protein